MHSNYFKGIERHVAKSMGIKAIRSKHETILKVLPTLQMIAAASPTNISFDFMHYNVSHSYGEKMGTHLYRKLSKVKLSHKITDIHTQ